MFEFLNPILAWLQQQFDAILAALNPMYLIESVASSLASILPEPSPQVETIANAFVGAVDVASQFMSMLDYFVNLQLLLSALVLILAIELGINVFRIWRTARSTLT